VLVCGLLILAYMAGLFSWFGYVAVETRVSKRYRRRKAYRATVKRTSDGPR